MQTKRHSELIVTIIGNIERVFGLCFAVVGPLSAIRAWPASGDSTGVGAGLSAMGLIGSLIIGGTLHLAGRGLIRRSQLSRRLQIGVAIVVVISSTASLLDGVESIFAALAFFLAVCFIIVMLLPSIRKQFADGYGGKE